MQFSTGNVEPESVTVAVSRQPIKYPITIKKYKTSIGLTSREIILRIETAISNKEQRIKNPSVAGQALNGSQP